MLFDSPMMLIGLAAMAVPVVIHLLNRRRHQAIDWGAMKFLLESMAQQSKRVRIEEFLLLLLRMALLGLLALAMAQPIVQNPYFSRLGKSHQDVVLVLDGSMSTALEVQETSNFQRQVHLAERIINALQDGDTVRIMLAASVPTWLTPSPEYISRRGRARIIKQLAQLKPTTSGLDMVRCLDEAVRAAAEAKSQHPRIIVLTDGQRHGWKLQDKRRWDYLARTLSDRPIRPEIRVLRAGELPESFANAGIVDVRASRKVIGTERPVHFLVTVANSGTEPQPARTLSWSIPGEPGGAGSVAALLPGQKTTVSISHRFTRSRSTLLELRLSEPDDLPLDDTWSQAVQVLSSLAVLVVDGDPLKGRLASESAYLQAALNPDQPQDQQRAALVNCQVVTLAGLGKVRLSDYEVVVLANVPRLPGGFVRALDEYVRRGGGLWIAPGDRVNLGFYNGDLFGNGSGLLPAQLGDPVGEAEKRDSPETVALPSGDHPAMQLLADAERLDLPEVHIYRRYALDRQRLPEGASILLSTTGGGILAVEKALGKGRIIQTAIPLDLAWSDLPLRNAYVVLVHEWLYYLADPLLTRWNVRPGEPLVVSLPAERTGPSAEVVDPEGNTHQVPGRVEGGRIVFRFAATERPGRYRLEIAAATGRPAEYQFCVLPDSGESQFQPMSREALDNLAERIGLASDQSPGELLMSMKAKGPGRAIWHWFALGVLALLVVEVWMTRHMSSRRRAAAAGAA